VRLATLQGKLNAAEQELAKMKAGYEKHLADAKMLISEKLMPLLHALKAAEKKCHRSARNHQST